MASVTLSTLAFPFLPLVAILVVAVALAVSFWRDYWTHEDVHVASLPGVGADAGVAASLPDVGADAGCAPRHLREGGRHHAFSWIRHDNSQVARAERRKIAQLTQDVTRKRGYTLDGAPQTKKKLLHVEKMLAGTRRMAPSLGNVATLQAGQGTLSTRITKSRDMAIPAALKLRDRYGDAVTVVNAASSYHVGGGFETGGRHALEEALCVQTTIHPSIVAARDAALKGSSVNEYIPQDGVIMSPNVEVIRNGADSGYDFLEQPAQLAAIVSVAMFNANPSVRDAPMDMPTDQATYEGAVRLKFRSVLAAALVAKSMAIVVPDVGCGVYGNDAAVVGKLFGETLKNEFWGRFQEVALVGKHDFQDAAELAATTSG